MVASRCFVEETEGGRVKATEAGGRWEEAYFEVYDQEVFYRSLYQGLSDAVFQTANRHTWIDYVLRRSV